MRQLFLIDPKRDNKKRNYDKIKGNAFKSFLMAAVNYDGFFQNYMAAINVTLWWIPQVEGRKRKLSSPAGNNIKTKVVKLW